MIKTYSDNVTAPLFTCELWQETGKDYDKEMKAKQKEVWIYLKSSFCMHNNRLGPPSLRQADKAAKALKTAAPAGSTGELAAKVNLGGENKESKFCRFLHKYHPERSINGVLLQTSNLYCAGWSPGLQSSCSTGREGSRNEGIRSPSTHFFIHNRLFVVVFPSYGKDLFVRCP